MHHCFGRVTLGPYDIAKCWKETTNMKKEMGSFVEEVESSRNVHPMDLLRGSFAEGWPFQVAEGAGQGACFD